MASQSVLPIFNNLPIELLLFILGFNGPVDLCNFMMTCKKHYRLIIDHLHIFVKIYAISAPLEIERFMWSQFYNESLTIEKDRLFFKMMAVYDFPKTNIVEDCWDEFNLDEDEEFGELPEDDEELYVIKFQSAMLYYLAGETDINNAVMKSYKSAHINIFEFLFKFYILYGDLLIDVSEYITNDIELLISKGITFDEFKKQMNDSLFIGGTQYHIYQALTHEDSAVFINYMNQIEAGIDPETVADNLDL
jgi:hypothetical protein